jgi:hypothetical protein
MIYVPDWEKLTDGLARIMAATRAPQETAKVALCQAISDLKIAVQAVVAEGEYWAGESVTGKQLGIPRRLEPAAFDWSNSRPLKRWELGRYPNDIDWGERNVALLEVSTKDIIKIFGAASPAPAPKTKTKKMPPAQKRKIFAEWRASRGEDIPTITEDLNEMLRHDIHRDDVMLLREEHPSNPRGRPSTKFDGDAPDAK